MAGLEGRLRSACCAAALAALAGCSATEGGDTAASLASTVAEQPQDNLVVDPGDRQVLFGDLHLHTSYSLDAAGAFAVETLPDDAYRFAKGEPVTYRGRTITRHDPLDFLAVTDHAEFLGIVQQARRGELPLPEYVARMIGFEAPPDNPFGNPSLAGLSGDDTPGLANPALVHTYWQEMIDVANRHNDPGHFTALVGFEYSSTFLEYGASLHRNVIFRGPRYPAMPFGATDSRHPEALWAYAETNRAEGIESLMIPHNTNLSAGRAFAFEDSYGEPVDAAYAEIRRRNEPLVEITQKKGTSETRPELSPGDEFAGFEPYGDVSNPDPGSYVRTGLMRGMELAESTGINPFEIGIVGASDFHSGISASEEDNFPGALGAGDDQSNPAHILYDYDSLFQSTLAILSASGITGVWADENTREAIFDALRRRETYATSGPRIRVRLFAGWGDPSEVGEGPDWAHRAYRWGVPMGGELGAVPQTSSGAPNFLVQAAMDPRSGNLDRIQIVKLWRDGGQSFERIYDVAWSDGRTRDGDGRLAPVGNTVDVATATFSNTIGAPELFASWRDPEFDPDQQAIYYARVIEIPTPRWHTYLAARNNLDPGDDHSAWIQERAWTSPVFYRPGGSDN